MNTAQRFARIDAVEAADARNTKSGPADSIWAAAKETMNENAIVARLLVTVLLFANNKRPSRAARAAMLKAIRLAVRQAAMLERKAAAE